jgi:hypothetical protein
MWPILKYQEYSNICLANADKKHGNIWAKGADL